MHKNIPIGIDNFYELINPTENFLFVDKSLLIKELVDHGTKVSLILRPRRWGKTINMSMLQHFFAAQVNGIPTKGMFDQLKIAKVQEGSYLKEQGAYPVIFISFKNVKNPSWDIFFRSVGVLIAETYREHETILMQSSQLSDSQKILYNAILNRTCDQSELEASIKFLSECLFCHYKKTVMILIDEYDTALNAAYGKPDFQNLVDFFRGMLGSTLKGNAFLKKGVMTGILRLSKNKILSDLNNLKLYSLAEERFNQHFGFSEEEVKTLIQESNITVDRKELQKWYNGYRSGSYTDIYNPWSILNCIDENGALRPYWVKTGNEGILKDVFSNASEELENELTQLLAGGSIRASVDEYISFDEITSSKEKNEKIDYSRGKILWSLLWTTGYLKFLEKPTISGTAYSGSLAIPNDEISCSYIEVFPRWIRAFNRLKYDSFLNNLVLGKVEDFACDLKQYMLTIPSHFDFPKESNYHTFLLGLTASLQESHLINSNKEAGNGRADLLLIPKDTANHLGLILEFKREELGEKSDHYAQVATAGLLQIDTKKYTAPLNAVSHVKQILKLCIVFYGKEFTYQSSVE